MPPEYLTYQWLTPLLIGVIVFLVGTIGWMIQSYLSGISTRFEALDRRVTEHMHKVETNMSEVTRRFYNLESRVTRIEDHAGIK